MKYTNKKPVTKTLIIHPKDRSTDFLKPIYHNLLYKTVISGGVTAKMLENEIKAHDRIIMMGHGAPSGLFSMGSVIDDGFNAIHGGLADILREKDTISIWCNADRFIDSYGLKGFFSGMFISEVSEAYYCGVKNATQSKVDKSNDTFASIVGEHIHLSTEEIYENTIKEYAKLAKKNLVAAYNHERLYYKAEATEPKLVYQPSTFKATAIPSEEF